jgi:hypothetical protein
MKNFPSSLLGIFTILSSIIFPVTAQDITSDLFTVPQNTGANMTIGLNTTVLDQFAGSEIGAFHDLGDDGSLNCVGIVSVQTGFFGLALWGDDSSTPDEDGLQSGDVVQFAIYHDGLVILVDEMPEFTGYTTNSIVQMTGAVLSTSAGLCQNENACNFSQGLTDVDYQGDPNCSFPAQYYDCDGVCLDLNNNLICDIDESPGCTNPLYVNYDPNAGFDDGSCSETWEEVNSSLTSEIEILNSENQSLSDLANDLAYQLDTTQLALLTCLETPQCEAITIDLEVGWNIFGYTSSVLGIDIATKLLEHADEIVIMKDNNGSFWQPSMSLTYNPMGDFIPGEGYQIKVTQPFSILFEN